MAGSNYITLTVVFVIPQGCYIDSTGVHLPSVAVVSAERPDREAFMPTGPVGIHHNPNQGVPPDQANLQQRMTFYPTGMDPAGNETSYQRGAKVSEIRQCLDVALIM